MNDRIRTVLMRLFDAVRIIGTYLWLTGRVALAYVRRLLRKPHVQEERFVFELQISPSSRLSFPAELRSLVRGDPGHSIPEEFAALRNETMSRFQESITTPQFSVTFLNNESRNAIAYVSAFRNWVDGLQHVGVAARVSASIDEIPPQPDSLPNVLFCRFPPSDSDLAHMKDRAADSGAELHVFAPLQPAHGNEMIERYAQLHSHGRIAGCYSHSVKTYHQQRHRSLLAYEIPLISLEFAANPLVHFPVTSGEEPIYDFAFLGSTNASKRRRYIDYFGTIFRSHRGFIGGPGWTQFSRYGGDFSTDRHVYSRARIGLNLSVPSQLEVPRELNERTYQLAACGICQLSDTNPLLPFRFPEGAVWQAETPAEYGDLFGWLLEHPRERKESVAIAYRHVMGNHTVFHRAVGLISDLREVLNCD